jgi:hypothetical protein
MTNIVKIEPSMRSFLAFQHSLDGSFQIGEGTSHSESPECNLEVELFRCI